jgi:hypothetical protein
MKYTEFLRISARIKEEPFRSGAMNPFEIGIQKSLFEQERLRRLLELAEQTEGNVARRKADILRRQLQMQKSVQDRFSRLMHEQEIQGSATSGILSRV